MPESEIFKMAINGGMFGLWVLFLLWLFNRGIPMAKEHVEKVIASNQISLKELAADFKLHTQDLNATHKEQVKVLSDTHRDAVNTLDKSHRDVVTHLANECREERKEIMSMLYAKMGAEPKPNLIVPVGQTQSV